MASQQAELAAKVTEQGAAVADATAKLAFAKAESAKISAKLSADNLQRTHIDRSGPSAADALLQSDGITRHAGADLFTLLPMLACSRHHQHPWLLR